MRIDHAAESDACMQPMGGFRQEIIIEGDKRSTKRKRAIKQCGVFQRMCAILICRQHVHIAQAQSNCDRTRHMVIHVQFDRHRLCL